MTINAFPFDSSSSGPHLCSFCSMPTSRSTCVMIVEMSKNRGMPITRAQTPMVNPANRTSSKISPTMMIRPTITMRPRTNNGRTEFRWPPLRRRGPAGPSLKGVQRVSRAIRCMEHDCIINVRHGSGSREGFCKPSRRADGRRFVRLHPLAALFANFSPRLDNALDRRPTAQGTQRAGENTVPMER